ncbi:MAG: exonuclease SbcCD subunit D C-terminal domain-containing protein [Deltaproteobacteria bacterium]|nr:exonuclease SbcCD subunit D C-terminal domain-containing protein [Deltaproteobacteria bacterium]
MNILHTSDWHIGCSLYGRKRYEEHEAFLNWLLATLSKEDVDVLLVSGDIFDSALPSNRALTLYYQFLHRISETCCKYVIIIGGNHDSPSLLSAPRDLLKHLNIHVIANVGESPDDEIIPIADESGILRLLVCAVPYLRDREIRFSQAAESIEEKGKKLIDGISSHYQEIYQHAEGLRAGADIPLVVMGHLFVAGASSDDRSGERELYVGSLAHVPAEMFPSEIDYLALGHLHRAQAVGTINAFRYSGSPLPMSFSRADDSHSVCLLNFSGRTLSQELIAVPSFRSFISIKGEVDEILNQIASLISHHTEAWLEIVYTGEQIIGTLQQQMRDATVKTGLEVIRVINNRVVQQSLHQSNVQETLDELAPEEVFKRCLERHKIPLEQRPQLTTLFNEALQHIYDDDQMAE